MTSGAAHCSIHHAQGPQCPWCVASGKAFGISFLFVLPASAAVVYATARWRRSIVLSTLMGSLIYLIATAAAGWVTAHVMKYPTWFGIPL